MILKGLNDNVLSLMGQKISSPDGTVMTYKSALISICEMHQPSKVGAGEPVRAFSIGTRLVEAGDEIELNDEDAKFLKYLVENSSIFVSVIIGQVNKLLE